MENHHFQWENPLFQWPFSEGSPGSPGGLGVLGGPQNLRGQFRGSFSSTMAEVEDTVL
jgi:hypothetical protein